MTRVNKTEPARRAALGQLSAWLVKISAPVGKDPRGGQEQVELRTLGESGGSDIRGVPGTPQAWDL